MELPFPKMSISCSAPNTTPVPLTLKVYGFSPPVVSLFPIVINVVFVPAVNVLKVIEKVVELPGATVALGAVEIEKSVVLDDVKPVMFKVVEPVLNMVYVRVVGILV